MKRSALLTVDGIVNLILGILLVIFPTDLAASLGMPVSESAFYPSILGAVLTGIGIALLIENFKTSDQISGLGLSGAISINLCGALVLTIWLLRGGLEIPTHGYIVLWSIVVVLVVLSVLERISAKSGG